MNSLKVFLKALEEIKGCLFIPKLTILPQKPMPIYKEFCIEVYEVSKETVLISSIKKVCKSSTDKDKEKVLESLEKEIIKNILVLYGVQ